ncbi:MAG: hypothetical protein HFI90_02605 [Clostridia bacterium]|nr:hypothetical protein [Clostridia bacterium]
MNIKKYMAAKEEKPLDNIAANGGFCHVFRKIAYIVDSLPYENLSHIWTV